MAKRVVLELGLQHHLCLQSEKSSTVELFLLCEKSCMQDAQAGMNLSCAA